SSKEFRSLLDEELGRLPEKYRAPLVLHHLEGLTKGEAARRLGWTEGTISGRLARGRALLRGRLARRGLPVSGGALAAALSREEAAAAVPAGLTRLTAKTTRLLAAGTAAPGAARIAALAQRELRALLVSKVKIATAVVLVAAAVGLGAGGLFA